MKTDDIIKLADTFSEHSSLTISTVSTYAANDGKWLGGLKKNASCTLRKAAVVMRWFSDKSFTARIRVALHSLQESLSRYNNSYNKKIT